MKNLEKHVHIINKLLKKSAECTCGTTMVFLVFGESKTKQKIVELYVNSDINK